MEGEFSISDSKRGMMKMGEKSRLEDQALLKTDCLTFHEFICIDGGLWACSNRFGAYFRINPVSGNTSFEGWGKYCEKIGYSILVVGVYNNNLIIISRFGDYVELFNLADRRTKKCRLIFSESLRQDEYHFLVDGRYLILVSVKNRETFVFDIEEIISRDETSPLKKLIHKFDIITKPVIIDKSLIYLQEDKAVMEIVDLENWSRRYYCIKDRNVGIVDLLIAKEKVFLLYRDGDVVVHKKSTGEVLEYYKNREQGCAYKKIYMVMGQLWIFPSTNGNIFIIDLKKKSADIYKNYPTDFRYLFSELHPKYAAFVEDDRFIYVGQRSANYMLIIDKLLGTERWISVKLPKKFYKVELPKIIADKVGRSMIEGRSLLVVQNFLDYIINWEDVDKMNDIDKTIIGSSIYGHVKEI